MEVLKDLISCLEVEAIDSLFIKAEISVEGKIGK